MKQLIPVLFSMVLLLSYPGAKAGDNATTSKLTPSQKELALKTWQSNNLLIMLGEGFSQREIFPPANMTTAIGQQYASMMKMINDAVQAKKCIFTNSSNPDSSGHPVYVTGISGDQCPLYYMKTDSEVTGLATDLKVVSSDLQNLTEATESHLNLISRNDNTSSGTGYFVMKSLGKLFFTVTNKPGADNTIVSTQAITFPDFVAEVAASMVISPDAQITDKEYLLNGEALSKDEISTYFHVTPAFAQE